MPGGRKNPLSMSNMLDSINNAVQTVKESARPNHTRSSSLTSKMADLGHDIPYNDLSIQFIGASGLPKMDVVGSADPYFIAKLDDSKISFVSTVKPNNLSPVWNEIWRVKNVPVTASLHIEVMDKDEGNMTDDFIGKASTSVTAGAKEIELQGPVFRRCRGTMWIKIDSKPSVDVEPSLFPYLFDGPIRYSRHFSPTVGLLTNLDEARLYSTWKMYIAGVPVFFGDVHQPWNKNYKAAQNIFQGPTSIAVRAGIQAGHRMLYARTVTNGFGVISDAASIQHILHGGQSRPGQAPNAQYAHRVKPAVYTYIISSEDDSFRFSETGAAFFVDFASKHALHANCNETVRYSGEFHPRPEGGWENFSDDIADEDINWELVIDNNSGTYAPDKNMLPALQELLEYNFPGFKIFALHHEDEELVHSREACREYALKYRGVGTDELQPHAPAGEVTLSQQASNQSQATNATAA
ncbi:hypothetical protein CVT24_010972 [Panaeolus cyanescens]|uniref:C2 domain-containing protein n=1 Tax=Panaeolus cyanescens TaxID=181874 RepID=A0A409YVM7_9AGAR|nr:hypothetical protein CVT24_010972 [Panaeolus cyanescens]